MERTTIRDTEAMREGKTKRRLPPAMIFGIVAATLEMGILLWMMYC